MRFLLPGEIGVMPYKSVLAGRSDGVSEVTERLEGSRAVRSIGAGTSLLGDRRLEGQSSDPWEQLSGAVGGP